MREPKFNPTNQSVFDSQHRTMTLGIVLGVTLIAFEALAVVTVAPRISEALEGSALYGWIFSGFLLASLLGIVIGGQDADRHGARRPFAVGLLLFGAGLLLSGFAPNMLLLVAGRVVQGLGGGAVVTALYAAVTVAYTDALRPRVVALMSSAWVVPALVGPAIAGFLAEVFSWRVVFLGLVPLLALTALLTLSAFNRLQREKKSAPSRRRLLAALGLVAGTGVFLAALTAQPSWLTVVGAVAGAVVAGFSLRPLTPGGTLTLQSGLPSVIAARGLFYASFAGVQAFLALMLTSVHGFSSSLTGIAVATGAVSWTAGSWLQDRLDERSGGEGRSLRVVLGTTLLSLGLGVQCLALYAPTAVFIITVAGWLLAGLGIGLAHSTSSVLAFALAPEGEEGSVASALQLADQFTSALSTGIGGALLAAAIGRGGGEQFGILLAYGFSIALGLLGIFAAWRIRGARVKGKGSSQTNVATR